MTHRLRGDTSASSDPVVRAAAKSDRRSFAFGTRIKVESGRRRLRKRSTLFRILTPTLYLQRALISHWAAAKSVKHCAAPFLSHHWRWVRHRGSNRCHYLLNWLGHALPSPSYLYLYSLHFTSASMSLHFYLLKCFIVHTSFFSFDWIQCSERCRVLETNADIFRRNPFSFVFASDLQIFSDPCERWLETVRKSTFCSISDNGKSIFGWIFVDSGH